MNTNQFLLNRVNEINSLLKKGGHNKKFIVPIYIETKSVNEYLNNSDPDTIPVIEYVPEICPICEKEDELISYIRNSTYTRKVEQGVVHCTGTLPTVTVSSIQNYWVNNLGWRNPGYHIIFTLTGFVVLADFNTICNGVRGINSTSIHLSYVGGIDKNGVPLNTMNETQKKLISTAIKELNIQTGLTKDDWEGHNFYTNKKACPSFQFEQEFKELPYGNC